jgi:hypothetical protein
MQNDVSDDVERALMWHDLTDYWCGYLRCSENWFKWSLVDLIYIVRVAFSFLAGGEKWWIAAQNWELNKKMWN